MNNIRISNISKSFSGVSALTDVSLTIMQGQVLALCGENGAGKSTLINILAGHVKPDSGTLYIDDRPVVFTHPRESRAEGISTVHQHLSLVGNLSVAENILAEDIPLNRFGLIDAAKARRLTQALLGRLGIAIDPLTMISALSASQKQMIEIAKALSANPKVLILDEPTASLTEREVKTLSDIIAGLKSSGVAIIYISHRLKEVFELADRIAVLKDGVLQGVYPSREMTRTSLIRKMVGRDIPQVERRSHASTAVQLEVRNLSGVKFRSISFQVRRGEIAGFAGLVGSGRTEIMRAIFGLDPHTDGTIVLNGKEGGFKSAQHAVRSGIGFISEERRVDGIFPEMTIADNVLIGLCSMRHSLWSSAKMREGVEALCAELQIKYRGLSQWVSELSGGNQQKVILARWLALDPDLLILDEPTHGIDVGAKYEIYRMIRQLAAKGKSVIIVSGEMEELIALCDKIHVIHEGRLAGVLDASEATEEAIMVLSTGAKLN